MELLADRNILPRIRPSSKYCAISTNVIAFQLLYVLYSLDTGTLVASNTLEMSEKKLGILDNFLNLPKIIIDNAMKMK